MPYVIRIDRTSPVLFEAKITGEYSNVVFEVDGVDRQMFDDGTGGDLIAGDSVYSITFQASEITSKLTEADVYRPFIGFCKIFHGQDGVSRFNIFAEIWTEDIPVVHIEQLDSDIQSSSNIVNIVASCNVIPSPNVVLPWTNRFYDFFEDDYDFMNVIILPAYRSNRFHFAVKNEIGGLGLSLFDGSSQYGSDGRLLGITMFPISYFFDGAQTDYQHELGHQWINFLRDTPFETGIPHWPISDVASGVMGISLVGGQGGRFPYKLNQEGENYRVEYISGEPMFNDLELYLMGLLPADSVKPHFVFDDQNQTAGVGELLYGPVTHITIEDLIALVGPREPDFNNSDKKFRLATIVISDSLLDVEAMSFYNFFSRRAELRELIPFSSGFAQGIAMPFYVSTGGRGELLTHIGEQPTAVEQINPLPPSKFFLSKNYPNPFNPCTTLKYQIHKENHVTLRIFNLMGREVKTLVDEQLNPGFYVVQWNGRDDQNIIMSSGIFIVEMRAGGFIQRRKITLLK